MNQERSNATDEQSRQSPVIFSENARPPEEVIHRTTIDLQRRLEKERGNRLAERKEMAEQIRQVYAPLFDLVANDARAVAGTQRMREIISRQAKQKRENIASFIRETRPKIASESGLRVPPYDVQFGWENSSSVLAWANPSLSGWSGGAYSGNESGFEGFSQAAAGVGIAFRPRNNVEKVFATASINHDVWWLDSSNFGLVAHSNGYAGFEIDQFDLGWNPQPDEVYPWKSSPDYIWSDGTGWFDTHTEEVSVAKNITTPLLPMSNDSNYIIWFFSVWEADGSGNFQTAFFGDARCIVNANVPLISFWSVP